MKALLLLSALVAGVSAAATTGCPFGSTYAFLPAGASTPNCQVKEGYLLTTTAGGSTTVTFETGPTSTCSLAAGSTAFGACATGFVAGGGVTAATAGSACTAGASADPPVGTWASTLNFAAATPPFTCIKSCVVPTSTCTAGAVISSALTVTAGGNAITTWPPSCAFNATTVVLTCAAGFSGPSNRTNTTCNATSGLWYVQGLANLSDGALNCTNSSSSATSGNTSTNTSNTTPAVPVPAGSSATTQSTANAVAALGPNPPITSVIAILAALPANTTPTDFVASTNVALATAYPTTGTAMTAAQGETFFAALPATLTSNGRTITFTTSQINQIFQQIGVSSRGQTAAVVANRGQCVSACVALALLTGIRRFAKICVTNACAGLRQVNGLPAVSCSGTAQQQRDCWREAACAGQLSGVANCTVQNVAERCPSCDKSKKGLLGLLGLLGIIPLVLSSLLLSLLLLCIRRKKTAGAVQFATYDAGAQNVCVPGAPGFGPGFGPATCL